MPHLVLILVLATPAPVSADESNVFVDDDRNRFSPYLEKAAQEGILIGCNPPQNDRACPDLNITRREMAVLLDQAVDLPRTAIDADRRPISPAVEALAAVAGISSCTDFRSCPDRPVTRGEMAELISLAIGWETSATTGPYLDLHDSPFGLAMAALAQRGGLEACDLPVGLSLCPDMRVTRAEAVYALVSALGLQPAPASGGHTEAGTIGFADHFDALRLWGGRSPSSRNRVTLTADGFGGTGLRVVIPRGSHFGADFKLDFEDLSGDDPELLYFRYMLRFDPDWVSSRAGKLPGFSGVYGRSGKGGYRSTPNYPGWSARLQWFPNHSGDPRVKLGYYVYHLGQEQKYGDNMAWGEAARLQPGEWYCVEGEVGLNTPGLADGALRAWVDETPVFDLSGLAFRRPGEPNIRINSFWFDVYYGGKRVPDRQLGLVIDEVEVDTKRIGCGSGGGVTGPVRGDFTGDGFTETVSWESCVTRDCFRLHDLSTSGKRSDGDVGNGAWFSLDTHRFGIAAGDLDADGSDELVYPGRCAGSARCWRVHQLNGAATDIGEDWGAGFRFTPRTSAMVIGDWNGDGLDDVLYDGKCGDHGVRCWRVHPSTGESFAEPEHWGEPSLAVMSSLDAADIDGDGRADLVYLAPCDDTTCWFAQPSAGWSFLQALNLGQALASDPEWHLWLDWNGDARTDLISIRESETSSQIIVQLMGQNGVGEAMVLAEYEQPVADISLRRSSHRHPVEALVTVNCAEGEVCVEYLKGHSSKLLTPSEYRRAVFAALAERWGCVPDGLSSCRLPE